MCYTYIIYSKSIDKFYIGSSCDEPLERLRRHNSNHKGFTGRTNDWEFVFKEYFDSKELAIKRELQIKNWKNRKRIEELVARNKI